MHPCVRWSAAVFAAAVLASPASAQVTFSGFTNGCFYVGMVACAPELTPGERTDALGPLTYTNSTFSVMSTAGAAAIGEAPGTPNVNNLGSLTFPAGANPFAFTGNRFALNVMFTAPTGTTPSNWNYLAELSGAVVDNSGGVLLDFDNAPQLFTYDGGSFTFRVNDVSLTNTGGENAIALSGFITVSTVPEPGTVALLGGGLAALLLVTARRRRA